MQGTLTTHSWLRGWLRQLLCLHEMKFPGGMLAVCRKCGHTEH